MHNGMTKEFMALLCSPTISIFNITYKKYKLKLLLDNIAKDIGSHLRSCMSVRRVTGKEKCNERRLASVSFDCKQTIK